MPFKFQAYTFLSLNRIPGTGTAFK